MTTSSSSKNVNQSSPLIGIWWDDGTCLAAFAEAPDPLKAVHGICDSDFAHDACWKKAAKQLKISCNVEYFDVPRGRVMWHVNFSRSVILHGNGTSRDRLHSIADRFHLANWVAETDDHYLIGDAIDDLFR